MKDPKPEDIKALTLNDKLIANYVIDDFFLLLKARTVWLSEDILVELIHFVEDKKFNQVSFLNIE